MLGKRKQQAALFDVGNVFPLALAPQSFYAQLAVVGRQMFNDACFAALYHDKLGRPSVSPSALALVLLLQTHDGVSDQEAIARTCFDLRWAAVLGREAGTPLCAKSTLQLFRAHLVLHDAAHSLFEKSIQEAKRNGLLKGAIRASVDTKPILGRGAVEDTFNLLATGIRQLARALSKQRGQKLGAFLTEHDLGRFAEPSIKGTADIDWSDKDAKDRFLCSVTADASRLLGLASVSEPATEQAASLLRQILLQDIETMPPTQEGAGVRIKPGTTAGRVPSATDPEMRHGRKSESKRFDGHKASIAVDTDSQIIIAVDVLPGDAADQEGVLALVASAEIATALPIEETLGDCAYGGGPTRKAFEEAGRTLIAKERTRDGLFLKSAFHIDLSACTVTCPAGHTTSRFERQPDGGRKFVFGKVCAGCPLVSACHRSARGHSVTVHAQEALMQKARAFQGTAQGRSKLKVRVVVEHALARLSHLGIGQALYRGRRKTRFQVLMAATVANFRWTWNWVAGRQPKPLTNPPVLQNATHHQGAESISILARLSQRYRSHSNWIGSSSLKRRFRPAF